MSSGGYTVEAYYKEWFDLYYNCKMTFTEYENLLPFEREVFIGMWNDRREQEEKDAEAERKKN